MLVVSWPWVRKAEENRGKDRLSGRRCYSNYERLIRTAVQEKWRKLSCVRLSDYPDRTERNKRILLSHFS